MKAEAELVNIIFSSEKKQSLCRICLSNENNDPKSSLFEQSVDLKMSLSEIISLCTRVTIIEEDLYPKMICNSCLKDLNAANDFRIKCEHSDATLKKIFADYSIKNDPEFSEIQLDKLIDLNDIKMETTDIINDTMGDDIHEVNITMDFRTSDDEINIPSQVKRKECPKRKKKTKTHSKFKNPKKHLNLNYVKCEISDANVQNTNQDGNYADVKCTQCDRSFKSEYSLALHTNRMHTNKEYVGFVVGHGTDRRFCCTECQYQTKRRQTLEYHMDRHTGLKKFKCDECGRGFGQHSSLAVHKKTHSDKTYFTCNHCGKEFKHRHIFIRHLLIHTDERKFKCEICSKELKSKVTLEDHIKRHKQIKNYSCHVCALRFVSLPDLTNHLLCHNKSTKIYKCEICTYSTYTKRMLAAHVFRHTASKDFQCNQCEAAFQTVHKLEIHKRSHTKENKYPCPLCETKFRYSYSVNRHMSRVHNKKFIWNATVDRQTVK